MSFLIFPNMIYYIIPAAVMVISLGVILWLIWRKRSRLAALNIESIAEEKALLVKNRIILERLKRKALVLKQLGLQVLQPLKATGRQLLDRIAVQVGKLEQAAQQKDRPLTGVEVTQSVKEGLAQADQLVEQGTFSAAEEAFIRVLSLDAQNAAAYQGLIKVYLAMKDYKKAKETCRYIIKLLTKKGIAVDASPERGHRLASIYADLGWAYETEGRKQLAAANYEKAIELEPSNPRFLDLLLKISIILKRKDRAWATFNALKEADPDNKKLPELKEEIEKIKSPRPSTGEPASS